MILGSGRIQPEAFVEFTPKELKKCKVGCTWLYQWQSCIMKPFFWCVITDFCELQKSSFVALEKNDPVGWSLKAELHATNSVVDCKQKLMLFIAG